MTRVVDRRYALAGLVSAAAACLLASSSLVQAQEQVIRACLGSDGLFRAAGPTGACSGERQPLVWNVVGPAGPQGPQGPEGPEGPAGPAGRDGRDATGPAPPAPTMSLQMTVDGLNGNNPTPILNFGLGATNPGSTSTGGGSGSGKVTFQDLAVTKMLDGMSVALMSAAATGTHLKTVQIEAFAIGASTPFAVYLFEDALVTASVLGSSGDAMSESVTFNFARIVSDITLLGNTFHSCYDIRQNKMC